MSGYIEVERNGETLRLEYNRDAIVAMEDMGFKLRDVQDKVQSSHEMMIIGALKKNHPEKKMKEASEIAQWMIEEYGIEEIDTVLCDLYMEAIHLKGKGGKKLTIKGRPAKEKAKN